MSGLIPWRKKTPQNSNFFTKEFGKFHSPLFLEPFFPLNSFFADNVRWFPSIDIQEEDDRITVTAELPGMEKENIDVSIKDRFLIVKGEKSSEKIKEKKRYFRKERSYGYFERSVKLPDEVDDTSVKARYRRGVLTVSMKKKEYSQAKSIQVKTGNQN
jgi:HSP20 family protein